MATGSWNKTPVVGQCLDCGLSQEESPSDVFFLVENVFEKLLIGYPHDLGKLHFIDVHVDFLLRMDTAMRVAAASKVHLIAFQVTFVLRPQITK